MNNTHLYIANAHRRLDSHVAIIERAFERAIKEVGNVFDISDVDVICIEDAYQVIPETGTSGYTANSNLVYLYLDSAKTITEDEIFYTLCHEFAHIKRYQGPGHGNTLFDSMIFEGLGVAMENEMSNGKGSFLSNYITDKDNAQLLSKSAQNFDDHEFDRFHWFINETDTLPRWTGYRIGYYIISEYIKKTNKKASELITEDSKIFRDFVRDDLGRV